MENIFAISKLFIYNIDMKKVLCPICSVKEIEFYKSSKCKSCSNRMRAGKYKNKGGWHHTDEYKKMMSEKLKGRIVTEETKRKISGENHYAWKGDDVGYGALHYWIRKQRGTPSYCEHCKTSDKRKKYEWANVSGEYKRDINDFKRLCTSCHKKYDNIVNNFKGTRKSL